MRVRYLEIYHSVRLSLSPTYVNTASCFIDSGSCTVVWQVFTIYLRTSTLGVWGLANFTVWMFAIRYQEVHANYVICFNVLPGLTF